MAHSNKKFNLTKEQRKVYDFIVSYIDEHDVAPSTAEMMEGCSKSSGEISRYVKALKERGWIDYIPHAKRSITIL